MSGCCTRIRPDDGVIDRVTIDRAVAGHPVELTRTERDLVIWRLAVTRGWGLDLISRHLGYSRTKVAETLSRTRTAQ